MRLRHVVQRVTEGAVVADATTRDTPALTRRLESRVAAFDVSDSGRLRVSGDDAIDLLNRLSTNDLEQLEVGRGMGTALTTNKGRIIDLLRVLRRDGDLLVLTSPGTQRRVAEWIDFYTFAEDVEVEDLTGDTTHWLVAGADAAEAVDRARLDADGLPEYLDHRAVGDVTIVRGQLGNVAAYEVISPIDAKPPDADALRDYSLESGDLELLRVEQGVPAYPNELNEAHNPLEANLKPHISFNKGCYIGQEVVARLNTYDRVQRWLCQLVVDDGATLEVGAAVMVDDANVGDVTTSAPGLALAYLRKRVYEDGARVTVDGTGATVKDIRPPGYND